MKTQSQFAGSINLIGKDVKKGEKVTSSARPELLLESTRDKFSLNGKACKLMNVAEGETVVLFDTEATQQAEVNEQVIDFRFLICKGYDKNGITQGAKLGKNSNFSYTKVWGAMLINEDGTTEAKMSDLVRRDLVLEYTTESAKTAHVSLFKHRYEVVSLGVMPVAEYKGEAIEMEVFALTNVEVVAHNPQVGE